MAAQVTIKDLGKIYQDHEQQITALAPISISVSKEEFVCVIGRNGSGKSTLLKLIASIEKPTSGTIRLAASTAYVPQRPSLLPWRTVEKNLFLPGDVAGAKREHSRADIHKLLADFGLTKFMAFYPHQLSGGMQQKVALLRAALGNPACLLLDEPFASLDAITRLELQDWLLTLKQNIHASVICVTHDIREALRLADTIYVLNSKPGHTVEKFSVTSRPTDQKNLEAKLHKLLLGKS
jgi:ABC-type nitrate/sulfonate/bicarbonate transport system ATPase subunit